MGSEESEFCSDGIIDNLLEFRKQLLGMEELKDAR